MKIEPLTLLAALLLIARVVPGAEKALPLPEMTVSKTATPPVIDGKMAPGEWDHAPACTAFVTAFDGNLAQLQSMAQITYDDNYLYVVIKNWRGPGHDLLKASGRRPDDESIVFDYANEIWFCPPSAPQRMYQTLFNVYPGVMDSLQIPTLGYTAKSWKGKWEIASSQEKDFWVIEARAPISSFGIAHIEDGAMARSSATFFDCGSTSLALPETIRSREGR